MPTDIRGLPLASWLVTATLNAPVPANFTAAKVYPVLCMGVDCVPASPTLYVLLVDDAGLLRALQAPAVKVDAIASGLA